MALKRAVDGCKSFDGNLTAETVQSTALAFQSVDNIHSSDGLALGVFGVGDGITDDVLKENLKNTAGLLVDQAGDTLDTTAASKTADGGLGDTLDVVAQNFTMALGASFAESFASLSTSGHLRLSCLSTVLTNTDARAGFGPSYIPASEPPDWSAARGE